MLIIGLTGSIASGKSTITRYFLRHHIPVFDSDKIVHTLLGPGGSAIDPVLSAFGNVGSHDEGIDRQKLGAQVFGDKESLQKLEQILHPLVAESRHHYMAFCRRHRFGAMVLDVPLLFETGTDHLCDVTMMSWAPEFLLEMRAMQRPAMTKEKFHAILSHQLSQFEKAKLVDEKIATGIGYAAMTRQLHKLCHKWRLR
ncbi:MAG: dephospho-CoA kinase [Candidatus Puniceispirillaceae bacterium]